MRLDDSLQDNKLSHAEAEHTLHSPHRSSIDSFPINDLPVMDTLLKDMLLSLQNSLYADFA